MKVLLVYAGKMPTDAEAKHAAAVLLAEHRAREAVAMAAERGWLRRCLADVVLEHAASRDQDLTAPQ